MTKQQLIQRLLKEKSCMGIDCGKCFLYKEFMIKRGNCLNRSYPYFLSEKALKFINEQNYIQNMLNLVADCEK